MKARSVRRKSTERERWKEEKLEEMTRKTQTFQTSLAMAALELKEKLALVLDPSSQDNSIA